MELGQSLKPETLQKNLELTQDIFSLPFSLHHPRKPIKALASSPLIELKQTPVHEAAP